MFTHLESGMEPHHLHRIGEIFFISRQGCNRLLEGGHSLSRRTGRKQNGASHVRAGDVGYFQRFVLDPRRRIAENLLIDTYLGNVEQNDSRKIYPAKAPWNQNLQLNVGDGNKIVGEYDLTNPENGRTHFGSVTGEINGEQINLTVSMQTFYATYKIHFTKINDTLYGTRTNDQTGESWALTVFKK